MFNNNRNLIISFVLVLMVGLFGGVLVDRHIGRDLIDQYIAPLVPENILPRSLERSNRDNSILEKTILNEESTIIDVVDASSPSVVTVGIKKSERVFRRDPFESFFNPFGFGGGGGSIEEREIEQDIGTGFVVSDGLIVTNKHVVSDGDAEYQVFSTDGAEYEVEDIYRDPTLDMAILNVSGLDLEPLPLGDSDQLRVGQMAIAIGTALGEFRNTVTTGVVSGIGRSIMAGGVGFSESLDNVIQTDAALNPGNSGGPLLNSLGQVIGVSVATSIGAENISFAIPINLVRDSIDNFNQTGRFERAFFGVQYRMIDRQLAIMNDLPEGAYIVSVVEGSAAQDAGLEQGDIVTKFDGQNLSDIDGGLAKAISEKKIGDRIEVEFWRDEQRETITVTLGENE